MVFDDSTIEAELEHRMDRTFRFQRLWNQYRTQIGSNSKPRDSSVDLIEPERKRVELLRGLIDDLTADELLLFFIESSRVGARRSAGLDEASPADEKEYYGQLGSLGTRLLAQKAP